MSNPRLLVSRLYLIFALLFSTWALLDVSLWATNDPALVMFSWSIQVLLEPLIYAIAFYLFYLYLYRRPPSLKANITVTALLLPLILLLPTIYDLQDVHLSTCEATEGPLAKYYTYFLNLFFVALLIWFGKKRIPQLEVGKRKIAVLFGAGLLTFLLSFTSGNIISSFTDNWVISQYGLFGMPIFAFLIAYSVVRFEAFQIKVVSAKILVVILWASVGSLLFIDASLLNVTIGLTLVFTTVAGYLLVRSVTQEFRQRQQLERLTAELEHANDRLKELDKMKSEFVSIASHQLRSPLTSIRGYASMLSEGSFGKLPAQAQEAVDRIKEASRLMSLSVEDYLNVSRIQSGNMKYELSDFNLRDMVMKIVADMRTEATHNGLSLTFNDTLGEVEGLTHADIGKTNQILHNLIDNAMKYTPKGSISVLVSALPEKRILRVDVKDTGVGMKPGTIEKLFEKFRRADNANGVNVSGTGLGLYIARKMAQDMKGDVTAFSRGEGTGSTFTLTLPLVA